MYRHLRAGRFGNTLRSWKTYGEVLVDKFNGKLGLRYNGPVSDLGGAKCAYDLDHKTAIRTFNEWVQAGADPTRIMWCEAAPDQHIVLQGEILQTPEHGYALHYSTYKAQMRIALAKAPKNHLGPGALLILKAVMDPASYEDLTELFIDFPGATVEFSSYKINLGHKVGRNTVFWEVRSY
jgi:hypothetical protein